jgi:hypothetical protein
MTRRLLGLLICAAVTGACAQTPSETAMPAGPTASTALAATGANAAAGAAASSTQAKAGERPFKAKLTWTATGIQWAGVPGQATSTFGGRCSVESDYVIGASFEGEATHAGRVTGTTEHCSQLTWWEGQPVGAAYSDGRGIVTSANGSTIIMRYENGTSGADPATGKLWFHDVWTFTGGTGLFQGATGSGEEGGSFADFNAVLAGAPVSMWMEGTITYNPGGKK